VQRALYFEVTYPFKFYADIYYLDDLLHEA